jgi:hypothetical protein
LEAAVPLGVEMHWECETQKFVGRVRYCIYRDIGYFVGVEFNGATKWSEQVYKPRHLLDLKQLVANAEE